jgi:hypothetical protein
MTGDTMTVDGLESDQEYEFFVCRTEDESHASALRLVRTGFYPDLMVNYCHPQDDHYISSGRYLCDPSIVRTPSGALVISMDIFAPNMPQNMSVLYRSEDNGKTWRYLCDLVPCFFETLFVHNGVLYMLATSTENGNLLIGASYDEGYTEKESLPLEQTLLRLGDVVLVSFPYELFTAIGMAIRNASPFPHTLPLSLTNGRGCYFITEDAIPFGGYEVTMFLLENLQRYPAHVDRTLAELTLGHLDLLKIKLDIT